jgi:hypothetical protein
MRAHASERALGEREASRGEVGANGAGDYDRNISFSEK